MTPQPPDADVLLETRGQVCPIPVIKTSEAIRRLAPGGVVHLISDDPAIEFDLPAWCRSMGHTIAASHRDGNDYHYFVRKR